MTDNDQERGAPPVPPPPRRRKAASPKRVPPPPRRSRAVAGASNGADDPIAMLVRQNQELLARIDRLESGQMRYVEPTAEPTPSIPLSPAMSDFTRGLAERTHEVPDAYAGTKEPQYNVPLRTYLKPPPKNRPKALPEYAELQGDARNVRHYQEKGYYLLTTEEERRYREVERPRLLAEQRTRAALINAMRMLVKREATLSGYIDDAEWDDSLSNMTVEDLEAEWGNLCRQTPNPNRRLPRAERVREERDVEAVAMLDGVETTPPSSVVDALERQAEQAAQARRGGRTIEINQRNAGSFA
jgi:hypothetical protein